jgi:hypothetical protein
MFENSHEPSPHAIINQRFAGSSDRLDNRMNYLISFGSEKQNQKKPVKEMKRKSQERKVTKNGQGGACYTEKEKVDQTFEFVCT